MPSRSAASGRGIRMRGSPSSTDPAGVVEGAGWGVVIRRAPPTTGGLRRSGHAEETAGASGPHSMLRGSGGASPPPAPTSQNLVLAPCAVSVGDRSLGLSAVADDDASEPHEGRASGGPQVGHL